MVVAVSGDVKAEQVMPILEKYFGRLPMSQKPDETTTTEPPQKFRAQGRIDRANPAAIP